MSAFSTCYVSIFLCFLTLDAVCSSDECRQLVFNAEQALQGRRLKNHVIRVHDNTMMDFCEALCYMEPNCASYNFMRENKTKENICELNNSTHEGHLDDLEENPSYVYHGSRSSCVGNPCKNKATCQTGFTDRDYRCFCAAGFTGQDCEIDVDECTSGTNKCGADAVCNNIKGSYSCTCKPGFSGDGRNCTVISCEDLYQTNSVTTSPYCRLGACGIGPWTLVMKIDGTKQTFQYNSQYWSTKQEYNPSGGQTGFDKQETKLETYWNTPLSKICLGMKIDQQINFIVINKQANSLYSLIADGQYRNTSLGRDKWKTLIGSQASLQVNCNNEGFNTVSLLSENSKARIGIISNEQNNCDSCDSRIGFGTGGGPDDSNTCGNEAMWQPDNGDTHIKGMGYIFVQ